MPQMPDITIQLIHIQGPLKGQIQDFSQFPIQIGRHPSCEVRFEKDLTTISRRHARVERQGNRFRIIDTSTNGTYVNGKRIADVYLRDGDVITFSENGPKASFLTKIETSRIPAASPALSTPAPPQPPSMPQSVPAPPVPHAPASPRESPPPPDAGLTIGPAMQEPSVSTTAPLVIQYGPTLRSFNLLPVTVGTDPKCEFVIDNNALAGRHVQIFFSEGDYYVKDLTGRNMVCINGRPVGLQMALAQGAELALTSHGPKFRFLGGGRLAEVQESTAEPLEKTDVDPNAPAFDNTPSVPRNKSKSLFKSFFK